MLLKVIWFALYTLYRLVTGEVGCCGAQRDRERRRPCCATVRSPLGERPPRCDDLPVPADTANLPSDNAAGAAATGRRVAQAGAAVLPLADLCRIMGGVPVGRLFQATKQKLAVDLRSSESGDREFAIVEALFYGRPRPIVGVHALAQSVWRSDHGTAPKNAAHISKVAATARLWYHNRHRFVG